MFLFFILKTTSSSTFKELVIEILFGKGQEYTQINNLVEAIRQGRSGCGKDVTNGPLLTNEMMNHSSWKKQS